MTKIIDIIPPKTNKSSAVKISKSINENKKSSKFLIFLIFFLISGIVFAFFIEGKGEIIIYPETRDITLEESIYISAQETNIDFEENIIPGEYFEEKLEFEHTFPATGSDETGTKASGVITVYNNYKEIKIIANSRFESETGLTYFGKEAIIIPGKVGTTPGSVEVEVIAKDPGEEYNTTSATFSVPGLIIYPDWYDAVWAELKEDQKIEGGARSAVRVITKDDLDKAEKQFKEEYLNKAKASFKENLDEVGTFIYIDENIKQEFTKFIVLGTEGDKVDNFKIQAELETKGLVFRKSDLDKFIEKKLSLKEENKIFVPNSLSKNIIKDDTKENVLLLSVSAKTYPKISEVLLLNDIRGQEIDDCKSILKGLPEIKAVDVTASLFWKNRLPKKKENISIEIEFED